MSPFQMQVGDAAVSDTNPVPVYISSSGGGGGGAIAKPVATINYERFTGAAGALSFTIAEGALEISVVNSGTLDMSFQSASMTSPTILTPETLPGATSIDVRAPNGYVLEASTVTVAAAGQTVEYLVIGEA